MSCFPKHLSQAESPFQYPGLDLPIETEKCYPPYQITLFNYPLLKKDIIPTSMQHYRGISAKKARQHPEKLSMTFIHPIGPATKELFNRFSDLTPSLASLSRSHQLGFLSHERCDALCPKSQFQTLCTQLQLNSHSTTPLKHLLGVMGRHEGKNVGHMAQY